MFHQGQHNPFEDLQKIASANSGIQHQASVQEEAPNAYFVQGMNEEFNKIAKEMQFKDDYVNRQGGKKTGKQLPAASKAAPAKAGKKSNPVTKARLKAKDAVPKGKFNPKGTTGDIKGLGSTVSGDRRGSFPR